MSKIKILPDTLANKIAAGEVVERPASVVKELLENSLDANARRVRVEIDGGGKRLIKLTDDGEGMVREDAIMAFERHATSKLRDFDELEKIQTLGFRGEALPSIASVAKVYLRTKTAIELEGTEIEIAGGRMLNVRDLAWPGGTEMEIQELFFNVPARRKFLKSDTTESSHIANLVTHYSLANPSISFTLVQNNREVIAATPVETLRERAYQIFGADFIENLIEIDMSGEITVSGFVSKPQEQRASRDAQYLFVNGRFVRDRVLAKAISEAYKNVIPSGTHPVVMLMIELPCEEIDVNVHPAKTEVRFRRPFAVHDAVCQAIRSAFTRTKPFASFPMANAPTPQLDFEPISTPSETRDQERASFSSIRELTPESWSRPSPATIPQDLPSALESRPLPKLAEVDDPFDLSPIQPTATAQNLVEKSIPEPEPVVVTSPITEAPQHTSAALACDAQVVRAEETAQFAGSVVPCPLGQLHDSYIVAVDSQGLMLIDQHVAHERILFEFHLARILARELEVQRLLIPETIDLTPAQLTAYEQIATDLEVSGFEMMRLSGRTIAIKATPALLSANDARLLILEFLTVVERERRAISIEHFQREIAASIACRAAIKINTPLSEEKMKWLIDELMKTQSPTNCPHGRPIILRFSMRDIERGFKRI
ncbi:MAG: DNA mismatch repair endonuclease MutL [Acidobacteriota bacterium]